jgi:hypothetical protein
MDYSQLRTGDLLLFDYNGGGISGLISKAIKYFTESKYTHIGMIVCNPEFTNQPLKGIYVWESGFEDIPDPENNKIKYGVQFTPIEEILSEYKDKGYVYLRKLKHPRLIIKNEQLEIIHKKVHNKPYDINIFDWLGAYKRYDFTPQKTDRFWCSALIGYIYTKLNIIYPTTDWSILRPSDFSYDKENLVFLNGSLLEEEILIQ